MADEKKQAEKQATAPEAAEEKPAWKGSLSDQPFMPAPDGHDVKKDALEGA